MFPQVHNNNTNIRIGLMEILQEEEHSSTAATLFIIQQGSLYCRLEDIGAPPCTRSMIYADYLKYRYITQNIVIMLIRGQLNGHGL